MGHTLFRQMRYGSVAVIICAVLASAGFWVTLALQKEAKKQELSQEKKKQILRIQMQRGIGKEVVLATPENSTNGVRQAVESVSQFIENRSGLVLSENTKARLTELEQRALADKKHRLNIEELTHILTATAVDRLSTLTDEEVTRVAMTLEEGDDVVLRASGRGQLNSSEFISKAKAIRALSRQADKTLYSDLHAAIEAEVNSRVEVLKDSLPKHWGKVKKSGVTPLQAVLITYSVASDDSMGHSQQTLYATQELLHSKIKDKGLKKGRQPGKAFGTDGYLFATPLDIILDETTMAGLLNRIEEMETR